jgi:dipeptidyl aminopeptidase/acylaminoacyl peptidase
MKWGVAVLVTASLWLGSVNVYAQSKAPPAVEAFGRVPAIGAVALSPSGRWVAWIDNSGAASMIEIFDLEQRASLKRVNAPADLKLRGLDWADDEILLIHGSLSKALTQEALKAPVVEWFRTVAMEVPTGKARILLHRGDALNYVTGASLLALRTSKPKTVMMSSWGYSHVNHRTETGSRLTGGRKDEGWTYNVYEVDTLTGEGRLVDMGTPFTDQWVLDANGQATARGEWIAQQNKYTIVHRRGGGWTEIFAKELDNPPHLLGLSRDGAAVLMTASLDRSHLSLWRVPVDGSAPQAALGDESNDITSVVSDPYSRDVLGAWIGGAAPELRWIDESAGKRAKALQKTFGGKQAFTIGRSADNARALLSVGSHATPDVYYLVDFKRGAADIIGEEYPALVDIPLGEVRELTYKARDGYDIPAYLTLPPTVKAEKLPLVVLPHGGPESRDTRNFDFVTQFLASRGYAVLQPQFRGSTGFGVAHRKAGYRQWGKLMQDDVTDGVRAMIDQNIADPKRVCIAGMSYGGYAALAGAAFTPELYACAISVNGVSDLPNMLGYERRFTGADSDAVAYWKEHIGPANSPDVIGKSPARAARNVRAPVLLMHGVDDSVVPISQSQGMMRALGSVPPHELIELPGEDHWLSRSATRIRVLTEMERFLAKHLPAAGQSGD